MTSRRVSPSINVVSRIYEQQGRKGLIKTEIRLAEAASAYTRFATLIGRERWKSRVDQIRKHTAPDGFLRDYLLRKYSCASMLESCAELLVARGELDEREIIDRGLQPAIAFMMQALSLYDACVEEQRERFLSRIRAALIDADEMRGLQLEMLVAAGVVMRGYSVRIPEIERSVAGDQATVFDILVEDFGETGIEIECKAIGEDTGRKIRGDHARNFYECLSRKLEPILEELKKGIAVVVTVPDRFEDALKTFHKQSVLADYICSNVRGENPSEALAGVEVVFQEFDPAESLAIATGGREGHHGAARKIVDKITGTVNRNVLVNTKDDLKGAVIVALRSLKSDRFAAQVTEIARNASSRQLSKTRPGVVVLGIEISDLAMREAAQLQTELDKIAKEFYRRDQRGHVATLGFLSQRTTKLRGENSETIGASFYHFKNVRCVFSLPDLQILFNGSDPARS